MTKKITKQILVFLMLAIGQKVDAQQWLGRTTGNYSGTYGLYNNASSIADSRYRYYFNFWGRGINFYNDYLSYNAPVKINHWANNTTQINNYRDFTGKVRMEDNWLLENLNGKNKQFSFNQDIWGPSLMFPVSKNWNMSINTRQRSGLQMTGISEGVAGMIKSGSVDGKIASINNRFSANIQSYQELGFTLGGILASNSRHQLNGGASLKLIRGLGAAYIKGSDFYIEGNGSNSAFIHGDFQYAYTDDKSAVAPFNDPYGLFSLTSRGAGAGFDIGLNYTYRSKRLKYASRQNCDLNDRRSDYDLKLSLAFNDIGAVRYNKQSKHYTYNSGSNTSVSAQSGILDGFGITNQNGFDTLGKNIFEAMGAVKSSGFYTSLPASFNFQADFRFSKWFYTAIVLNQNLKSNSSSGLRSTSILSVIPRFESRTFEFSMPLTLGENYKNFYVGAYARIGPVFFGSDNLGGLLNVASSSEFRGADIYGGIAIGIGHCHSRWYSSHVDPVYMDSVKNDSFRSEVHDTLERIVRDTVYLKDTVKLIKKDTVHINGKTRTVIKRDTVYIEKTVQNRSDLEKDKQIRRNEAEILQLKKQMEILSAQKSASDVEKQKCNEEKIRNNAEIVRMQDEILKANRKISDLQTELEVIKKANTDPKEPVTPKGSDAEKLVKANKQIDSLRLTILILETNIEKCRKNTAILEVELLKKAELEKTEKNRVVNEAAVLKKRNDSLTQILNRANAELENLKKNSKLNQAEVLKKAEADKNKAENDARVARKQADSALNILAQKNTELENCKKNATMNSAEIVKKAEADKNKAENDARVVTKKADSLQQVLAQRNTELENCKKNSAQNNADVVKLKKAEDENAILKAEILDMSKNIGKLNTKNYALSKQVDSLVLELKNCCKNCSTGNNTDAGLLKKCKEESAAMEAEIIQLKSTALKKDKSLDSLKNIASDQMKKQVELNAQISKLKTEIAALQKNENSDELQKQLNDKTSELEKVKAENIALQNKLNALNQQFNEYRSEYNYLLKQNQKCNMKLDSCMRGLYHTEPAGPKDGEGDGKGGPHQGSIEGASGNDIEIESGNDSSGAAYPGINFGKGLEIGTQIINILLNSGSKQAQKNGSGTAGSSGNNNSGNKAGTGSGNTTENNSSSETGSGGSKGNSGKSGSDSAGSKDRGKANDRAGDATDGSARRR